jgi:hypothetical protein
LDDLLHNKRAFRQEGPRASSDDSRRRRRHTMSRQTPPFPSKRPGHTGIDTSPYSSSATRPLQINRPPRPTTPSNVSVIPNGSPTGLSRPQRSDLRINKAPEYSVSDAIIQSPASMVRRDSASTTRSDISSPNIYRTANGSSSSPRTRRTGRTGTEDSDATSPPSLAMSPFQSGLRNRAMRTNGDNQREERQRAIQAENATQERIKRRMPGRTQIGAAKTGDIDGRW